MKIIVLSIYLLTLNLVVFYVFSLGCFDLFVGTHARDLLEKLVSEITYNGSDVKPFSLARFSVV